MSRLHDSEAYYIISRSQRDPMNAAKRGGVLVLMDRGALISFDVRQATGPSVGTRKEHGVTMLAFYSNTQLTIWAQVKVRSKQQVDTRTPSRAASARLGAGLCKLNMQCCKKFARRRPRFAKCVALASEHPDPHSQQLDWRSLQSLSQQTRLGLERL